MEKIIKELIAEMKKMPVVDAHEHLPAEAELITKTADVLTRIYDHYSITSAETAGLRGDRLELKDTSIPLEERWKRFRPYLNAIKDCGYAVAAQIAARDLYGIEEINDNTYLELSEKLQAANQPGLYDNILKEKCGIRRVLNQGAWDDGAGGYAVTVSRQYMLSGKEQLAALYQQSIENAGGKFTDPITWLHYLHQQICDSGSVGIKFHANHLAGSSIQDNEAAGLFQKLQDDKITDKEAMALEIWIAFKAIELAPDYQLTVAVHCGINWNCWNDFSCANPVNLTPVVQKYRDTVFDLYHGGIPYVREIAVMANQFPNINLNLVWCHQISPYMTEQMLNEWIDLVPVNKIIGFGGDNCDGPEVTYGVLQMAKENIARALAVRIKRGQMTESRAAEICLAWLYDNPRRIYNLD